jgi:hypothetical protein
MSESEMGLPPQRTARSVEGTLEEQPTHSSSGLGAMSTLSRRRPSMSTTSKQYPDASIRSPYWGTRRRCAMTRPPRVRNSHVSSPFTE